MSILCTNKALLAPLCIAILGKFPLSYWETVSFLPHWAVRSAAPTQEDLGETNGFPTDMIFVTLYIKQIMKTVQTSSQVIQQLMKHHYLQWIKKEIKAQSY